METTTDTPTETTTDASTEIPERLFRVTSTVTLREEQTGGTRRYDGAPVVWEVARSPEEAPFDVMQVLEGSDPARADAAASLFTREEAFRFLEDLEEEHPEGEHRFQSVPLPASEEHLRYGPGASRGYIEVSGELDVTGHCYPQSAEREGWEEGETLLVETLLELPVDMAERLDRKHDPAEYLRKLEETAEAVSEAPNPINSCSTDTDLSF
jgi:hypothetical protein